MLIKLKYMLPLIIFMIAANKLSSKPRTVYLDKELKEATIIAYVEILYYTDTSIVFQTVDSNIKMTAKQEWGGTQDYPKYTTAYWPKKGDRVLIVVGKDGYVSLFAYKKEDNYIFWSPIETESTALFYRSKPSSSNEEMSANTNTYEQYWDNCSLPINEITYKP